MRYITVPDDIAVKPPVEVIAPQPPEVISFRKYAFTVWLDDRRAIDGGFSKQVRWAKVLDIFEAASPGVVLVLEDEDWGTLKGIVDKPERGFSSAMVAVQLLAFPRAVLEAPDKPAATVNSEARPS
jgi:hypothetical protein